MPNHDRFECQTAIDSDAILQSARYEHLLPWRLKPFCRKMHYTGRMMAYSEITAATPSISVFTEGYVDDFASR
ncbi:hypothetical protein EYW94_23800 [Escherichia coli]|nr:hypothetical protein [Escherichia coli]EFA5505689.1 hypothetical protein [Escherichia coli]